jgi:hypothetical protein
MVGQHQFRGPLKSRETPNVAETFGAIGGGSFVAPSSG